MILPIFYKFPKLTAKRIGEMMNNVGPDLAQASPRKGKSAHASEFYFAEKSLTI
jgi:hypothetical protein